MNHGEVTYLGFSFLQNPQKRCVFISVPFKITKTKAPTPESTKQERTNQRENRNELGEGDVPHLLFHGWGGGRGGEEPKEYLPAPQPPRPLLRAHPPSPSPARAIDARARQSSRGSLADEGDGQLRAGHGHPRLPNQRLVHLRVLEARGVFWKETGGKLGTLRVFSVECVCVCVCVRVFCWWGERGSSFFLGGLSSSSHGSNWGKSGWFSSQAWLQVKTLSKNMKPGRLDALVGSMLIDGRVVEFKSLLLWETKRWVPLAYFG